MPSVTARPSTPRSSAFLHYAPLELLPNDDETQKNLKERYNAALRSLKLHDYQYDVNRGTPLGNMLTAARRLLEAKLALAQNAGGSSSDARGLSRIHHGLLEGSKSQTLTSEGAVGFSPVDEAQAREAMFDAKLEVARSLVRRRKAKHQKRLRQSRLRLAVLPNYSRLPT